MSSNRLRIDIDDIAESSSMGLLGACVSRDLRFVLFPKLSKGQIFWRINTISLMSKAGSRFDLAGHVQPANDFKSADRDINKTFDLGALFKEKYIVMDFYRDMYGIARLSDGRFITNGFELKNYNLSHVVGVQEKILPRDPSYPELWLESFLHFAHMANASDANIIVQPIYQVAVFRRETGLVFAPGFDIDKISRENKVLGHMQRIALAALTRSWLLPIPYEHLELDERHEFGPGPYHYKRSYFERTRDVVKRCPDLATSLNLNEAERRNLIEAEMNEWRAAL